MDWLAGGVVIAGTTGAGAAKTHAAPALVLSNRTPTMAVLPSAERDTDWPLADPNPTNPTGGPTTAPEPTSLVPCWIQTPPLLVQTHAAPTGLLSAHPPTMAVSPLAERDTKLPCRAFPTAPEPTNLFSCWIQTPPLLVHTHAAPACPLSMGPPTMAVLPSADRDTDLPWETRSPKAPEPTSLVPCWIQTPPLLVQTHTAPA